MSERRRRLFHLDLWGPRVDEGVDWEIEHHLEERIDELMAEGRTRAEAAEEARRTFGDLSGVRREMRRIDRQKERHMRLQDMLGTVWQDVRYGLRGLVRDSTFTLSLILTMGLGIGANVGMFAVLDALLLRPLPYHQPDELYQLMAVNPADKFGQPYFSATFADEVTREGRVFDRLLVHIRALALYVGGAEAMRLPAQVVSPEFEEVLGVQPALGRGFLAEDVRPGAERAVIVSHAFWRGALGGDPNIVGSMLELDGDRHRVIGVMPAGFKFPEYSTTDVWLPLREDGKVLTKTLTRETPFYYVLARVPEDRRAAVSARLATEGTRILRSAAPADTRVVKLESMQENRARGENLRRSVWLLGGAALLILLLALVNVVNLLLVRSIGRTREIAVRLAIGASRARLIRQLTTETFTITLLSSAVAVLFALLALRAIQNIMPDTITFFAPYEIGIERRALAFALLLTTVCGLILGLAPALLATRRSRQDAAGDLSRYATRTPSRSRLRQALVTIEVALSFTLLIGAGLFIRSFLTLHAVNAGFEPDQLAVLRLAGTGQRDQAERTAYLQQMKEMIAALPGVAGVTMADGLPPRTTIGFGLKLQVEGQAPRTAGNPMILPFASVQPDFFTVMGARLLAGRVFAANEPEESVIIDEDLARFLWPNGNAAGRRFRRDDESPWLTVVGVMADLKLMGPDDRNGDFEMLLPLGARGAGTFAIRARGDLDALLPQIRKTVQLLDPRQPIEEIAPATRLYAEAVAMPRFLLVLMSVVAGLALTLAAVGIYGVLAFGVSLRAHELGVRMALGARATDLLRMVVREGFALAVLGALIGAFGAFVLGRFIKSLLYGIAPVDPITFAAVFLTIGAAALTAAFLPARRAARVNPVVVLRSE